MTPYRPRQLRPWRVSALALRALAALLSLWPLLLVAAVLLSPVGPHLRWSYVYQERGSQRHYLDCLYVGSRGWVRYREGHACPLVTIIDRRVAR